MAKKSTNHSKSSANFLRIIGGEWRGRKINFPTQSWLRPTPDRVRETLFNWLRAAIPGARCLDLFAGSGALGLEALSRGATTVDWVDNSTVAAAQIQHNLQQFNAPEGNDCQGRVWTSTAKEWLIKHSGQNHHQYDIIFLDPPFQQGLAEDCIKSICQQQLLAKQSWVYLEMAVDEDLPAELPSSWQLHREKTAGQVCYRLFSIDRVP